MDIVDIAQNEQEWALELALNARTVDVELESADNCNICDIEIPYARRAALPGVQTCVDCQELLER